MSIARLGAVTQVTFATLLGGVSALGGWGEPDFLPRPIVLFGVFALPGVIGLLAIKRGRPGTLLGAAGASAIGSFLAFSGVTLIFLVPATLMGVGALLMPGGSRSARSLAVEAGRATLVLTLLVGAGAGAILMTEERCWDFRGTPQGSVFLPKPNPSLPMLVVPRSGYGCSNGLISARGVGLGSLLGASAFLVASLPIRKRRQP